MEISITARDGGFTPMRTLSGEHRLSAEVDWVVQGDAALVAEVEAALPPFCERIGTALVLRFGNAVGGFDGGPLGPLVVHSDKWAQAEFDRMLADISKRMALLPFSARGDGGQEHTRETTAEERVLYHSFVYLRHLLSDTAPAEDRLLPALRLVVSQPHRRFERVTVWSPLATVRRVDPRGLLGMVTPRARLSRAPRGRGSALAAQLGGHLPEQIEETRVQATVDVAENRFVKAFVAQAVDIIEEMHALATALNDGHVRRRVLADCEAMTQTLRPIRSHSLWDEVSVMRRVPAESQVLQRRHGYREVLRHYVRLRLAVKLPMRPEAMRQLLEIKDIAELYEMWCFFEVERQVTIGLGTPPRDAEVATVGDLGAHLRRGLRVAWAGGIELFYNLNYSRKAANRSYSLSLRPDVVLRIPAGPCAGDHLFDAKFKVRKLVGVGEVDVGDDGAAAAQRGMFKPADLYKMHAYRDAIETARSVWILYPGSEFRFFQASGGPVESVDALKMPVQGVGAIPLRPGDAVGTVAALVRRMVRAHDGLV